VQILINLFCFFLPPSKKKKETPTHIAAHLQAHANQCSDQRLAKELQIFHGSYFLYLSLYINILM
jgi:hypothetical protein